RSVLGGSKAEVARNNVTSPFDILIATPGRLIKFLDRGLVRLKDIRVLVFDEVDQMLDEGFLPDAKQIVAACPPSRQLALFSATVSTQVQNLMKEIFTN